MAGGSTRRGRPLEVLESLRDPDFITSIRRAVVDTVNTQAGTPGYISIGRVVRRKILFGAAVDCAACRAVVDVKGHLQFGQSRDPALRVDTLIVLLKRLEAMDLIESPDRRVPLDLATRGSRRACGESPCMLRYAQVGPVDR